MVLFVRQTTCTNGAKQNFSGFIIQAIYLEYFPTIGAKLFFALYKMFGFLECCINYLERGAGIEPATLAWKARVIPFYEPRMCGALDRIRTGVLAVKGRCPGPLDDESKTWRSRRESNPSHPRDRGIF